MILARPLGSLRVFAPGLTATAAVCLAAACSSSSNPATGGPDASPDGVSFDAPVEAPAAMCSTPGMATAGPADTHCGGRSQQTTQASCYDDAGAGDGGHVPHVGGEGGADEGGGGDGGSGEAGSSDDGGAGEAGSGDDGGSSEAGGGDAGNDGGGGGSCDYGTTMFGHEGDDDDCKYHLTWTSSPICEGADGVIFTVAVTSKVDGSAVGGIPKGVLPEVFIPKTLDASCDDMASHISPGTANLVETAPGSGIYSGPIVFDMPGEWTVRFHIHAECVDQLDTSPHGHAAFHVTVP
jgi:hypothetical protein